MHSDTVPWQWQCHLHIQIILSGSLSLPFDLNVSVLWKLAFTNRSRLFCIQTSCDLWLFGYIVFWRVIYEWTMVLTVIDAME